MTKEEKEAAEFNQMTQHFRCNTVVSPVDLPQTVDKMWGKGFKWTHDGIHVLGVSWLLLSTRQWIKHLEWNKMLWNLSLVEQEFIKESLTNFLC